MPDPLIGRTIGGRFRLIQRVGSGGMSSVYLAKHVLVDRLMAIKTLRRDLSKDPIQRDRFIREARAVNRINHENIVEITDFGETDDGLVYLVMEYVPGEPLLKLMTGKPFELERAFDIAHQCGSALARAHRMGVVHRDLKPENVLIVPLSEPGGRGPTEFVKILDFGIAKIMDAPSLTGSQQIFGTPGYIAPEYIQSTQIDGRADLYSLGVILYELITGALPFDYEYPGDLLVKHITEMPIAPSARRPDIGAPTEEFLLRCLEKDPNRRFRDAYHFLDELRALRERVGIGDRWHRAAELASDVPTMQRPLPIPRRAESVEEEELTSTDWQKQAAKETESGKGPAIPAPPMIPPPEKEAAVLTEAARRQISMHPAAPPKGNEHGLLGVRRWRHRFDAIRSALDELEMRALAPTEIASAMAFAEKTLEAFEEDVEAALQREARIEARSQTARDLRSRLGRSIDELARELSRAQGEIDGIQAQKHELTRLRDIEREKLSNGQSTQGRADELMWQLSSLEESLKQKREAARRVSRELRDLETSLDLENERFENELASEVEALDRQMRALESLSGALRSPLDKAAAYVRSAWPSRSS